MNGTNKSIRVSISGQMTNVIVHAPLPRPKEVNVNGKKVATTQDVSVHSFPSEIVFSY
jgi:hypothetical protein